MITSLSSLVISLLAATMLLVGVAARADGRVIRVMADAGGIETGESWEDAYSDLQDALAAAVEGDEIWVAAGTYKPTTGTDRQAAFFMRKGVSMYGGFAGTEAKRDQRDWEQNKSILSGEIGNFNDIADNTQSILFTAADCAVDGLTFAYGNSAYSGGLPFGTKVGSAVTCASDPTTISNCIFIGNEGRPTLFVGPCSPFIQNCTFERNTGTCIEIVEGSPNVLGCVFNGDVLQTLAVRIDRGKVDIAQSAMGSISGVFMEYGILAATDCAFSFGEVGVHALNSSLTVTRCIFEGNSGVTGGAAINVNRSACTVIDSVFDGNRSSAFGGAIYSGGGTGKLTNCVFINNQSARGSAIYVTDGELSLSNCVLTSNTAILDTGGTVYFTESSGTLLNSILWANKAKYGEVRHPANPHPLIAHCNIFGCKGSGVDWNTQLGIDGGGNMDRDPLFVDPLHPSGSDGIWLTPDDGFRLQLNSPCIDAGLPTAAPRMDILGLVRTRYPDIGAYEFGATHNSVSEWLTYP